MATTEHSSRIAIIGAGTIGISLAALHLTRMQQFHQLTIVDIRADLRAYIDETIPRYLPSSLHHLISAIRTTSSIQQAVQDADYVQECGPENLEFKKRLWAEIEQHAPLHTLFWTATSGIAASEQNVMLRDPSRLLVVHPFNPPHILPLLEIVPSPETSAAAVDETFAFWKHQMGREPVILRREVTGFVAGRLAWILLREAIHLVNQGVVDVDQLDTILQNSMGPRWAYAGPFKSFHAGGGPGGLQALFDNVGGTIQSCWDDAGQIQFRDGSGWEQRICERVSKTYGKADLDERDAANKAVLKAVADVKDGTEARH